MNDNELRAAAVREAARYIDRVTRPGLISRAVILLDLEAAAERMEKGMTARGSTRVVAEEPEWGIAHVATPGSVWPLSEDGARETAAIEPGQWIIYSRPKTVTHEWVPVKQEGAETDA